jgi:hypothetical protein
MVALKRHYLVWSLLAYLVLVNAFMAAPAVAHAGHHAKHQAGTHSTGLCAWLCAAGQGIETPSVSLESRLRLVDLVLFVLADQYSSLFSPFIFLRGPPSDLG